MSVVPINRSFVFRKYFRSCSSFSRFWRSILSNSSGRMFGMLSDVLQTEQAVTGFFHAFSADFPEIAVFFVSFEHVVDTS